MRLLKHIVTSGLIFSTFAFSQNVKFILTGDELTEGFDMGVDSSGKQVAWVSKVPNAMQLSYPPNQSWGALFITVGPPADPPRPGMDFSIFKWLIVEMRGDTGGEKVKIGIKSSSQPDNGSEYKVSETLTSDWKEYRYPLSRFAKADSKNLYVVAEFVFEGKLPTTVFVRSVKYTQ